MDFARLMLRCFWVSKFEVVYMFLGFCVSMPAAFLGFYVSMGFARFSLRCFWVSKFEVVYMFLGFCVSMPAAFLCF